MRSLLVVPVESAAALDSALSSGADAILLNLGDSSDTLSSPSNARLLARDFLRAAQFEAHRPLLYVRVQGLDDDAIDDDLAAIMVGEPDGLMLGHCRSGIDVQHLGAKLAVYEAEFGLTDGETGIIAEAGTTARALFSMGSYSDSSPRLMALAWHAGRLAADLGNGHSRSVDLSYAAPLATARNLAIIAARAADVAAIDSASADLDDDAFLAECKSARRDGFNAKIAASPTQIAIINAVFDQGA
jgi:citrate lyase subunit beta/citryl-CoA lyase